MTTPEEMFDGFDSVAPIAAMWTSLRGQLRSEGMPADIVDECVKATAQMLAASNQGTTTSLQITLAKIQAAIMGVDISHIEAETTTSQENE